MPLCHSGVHEFESRIHRIKNMDVVIKECKIHGCTEFVLRKDVYYRCKKGSSDSVKKRRKLVKKQLVEYKGGKCEYCGYDKCISALEFHHINPSEKDFGIGQYGSSKSFEKMKQEVDKCILLCCNCHRELHWKLDNELGT